MAKSWNVVEESNYTPTPSAATTTNVAAPATEAKPPSFWDKVWSGTVKALNTRPEQVSGNVLNGGIKVREKTEEEKKLPPTMAAKRAANTMGITQGAVVDPLMAGIQLIPGKTGESIADAQLQGYQNARQQLVGDSFDGSRLIGNVLSPVAVKGSNLVNKGLGMWGKNPGLVRQGATMGAVAGLTQPVLNDPNAPIDPETGQPERKDFLTEKAVQVGLGGLTGGALNKIIGPGATAYRNAGNLPATPAQLARQQKIADDPVTKYREMFPDADLTWGQLLGGRANELEQKWQSLYGIGTTLGRAREKALHNQNVSMMNKALEPAGIKLPKHSQPGRGMFDDAYGQLSKQYDEVLDDASLHNPEELRKKIIGTLDENGNYVKGTISDTWNDLDVANGSQDFSLDGCIGFLAEHADWQILPQQ